MCAPNPSQLNWRMMKLTFIWTKKEESRGSSFLAGSQSRTFLCKALSYNFSSGSSAGAVSLSGQLLLDITVGPLAVARQPLSLWSFNPILLSHLLSFICKFVGSQFVKLKFTKTQQKLYSLKHNHNWHCLICHEPVKW